jgi:glycosyltransferase involved in cell wall biosynthesis
MNALEMKIIREVDVVITINEGLRKKLLEEKIDEKKIVNIYNGVDTNKFKFNKNIRDSLREELYLDDDDIVIGYIGTLSNFEGLDYLMNSIDRLKSNVKFLLIGNGVYKDKLLEIAKNLNLGNKFIYLGKLPFDKAVDYYNVIDIVAYPRKDNILCRTTGSYKLYEAMAMARPIIVSRLEPYLEVIEDRKNGLVCDCDNEGSLLMCLKELINNKELRDTLGENARQWVLDNREWNNIGGKLIDVYKGLLSGDKKDTDIIEENNMCDHLRDDGNIDF